MSDKLKEWRVHVNQRLSALENAPRGQVNESAKKRWEWDLTAVFTCVLALFAVLSFIALWVQLDDARNNFMVDQRPYIWVAEKDISWTVSGPGQHVSVTMPITNYGKSPAIVTDGDLSAEIGPDAIDRLREGPWQSRGMITPTGKTNYVTTFSSDPVNDEEMLNNLRTKPGWIALHGRIKYHDSFKHVYETDFCMTYQKYGAPWEFCPGNTNRMRDCALESCE